MAELLHASLPNYPAPRSGKVRDLFDLGDEILIVATDRISAFDVVMENGIPGKGRILNLMSAFWFKQLSSVCPNHIVSIDDAAIAERIGQSLPELSGRAVIAKKTKPLPIECVARGYISGSLFKEYKACGPSVHGLNLPGGLVDSSQFAEPIFTPATKAEEGHDENISVKQAEDLVGRETAALVQDWTLKLYKLAAQHSASKGLILADTKFEFGETSDGIIWIDEALTPDSSRYWDASKYAPGSGQPSFDKQFVRDYLESSGWGKKPPGPKLPPDVVAKTYAKYLEAFQRITGQDAP